VTHDLDVLRDLCTKIAVLAERRVVVFDTLPAVLQCSHHFVREFFHNPRARRAFQNLEQHHG